MTSDVIVTFGADLTALKAGIAEANTSTKSMQDGISSIGKGVTAVGTGFTAAFTVPIVAGFAFALKSASDVGSAFKDIEKQTGATGTQLDALKGDFRDIVASGVPNSLTDIAAGESDVYDKSKLLTNGLQLQGAQLDTLTEKFLNWSRISGASVNSLVDSMAGISSRWKMTTDQTSAAMDVLNSVSEKTNIDQQTLMDTITKVSIPATALGLSFKDTTSYVAMFSEAGLNANTMYTAMNKVVTDAAKAGENANTRWNEDIATLKQYVQQGNNAGISTSKWKDLTDDFSSRTLTNMIAGLKTGAYSWADIQAVIDSSSGSINKVAGDTETFTMRLDALKNQMEVAFQPIGSAIFASLTTLLQTLQPIFSVVTQIALAFGNLPAPIQTVIMLIAGVLAAIGPVLVIVGMIIGALAPLLPIIMAIGTAIGVVVDGGGLMAAFAGLPVIGTLLSGIIIPALAFFSPLLLPIIAIVAGIAAAFVLVATPIILAWTYSKTFRDTISEIIGIVTDLGSHISAAFGDLMSGNFKGALDELKTGFSDALESLKHIDWGSLGPEIVHQVAAGLRATLGMITDVWNSIKEGLMQWVSTVDWDSIGKQLATLLIGGIKAALDIPKMLEEAMSGGGVTAAAGAKKGEEGTSGSATAPTNDAFTKVMSGVVGSFMNSFISAMLDYLKGRFISDFTAALTLLIPVIIKMVVTLFTLLQPYVIPFLTKELVKIPALLLIAFMTGLAMLGTWLWGLISPIPGQLWQGFIDALGQFGVWVWGLISPIPGQLWEGIVGALGTFGAWLWGLISGLAGELWISITTALGDFGAWLLSAAGAFFTGLPGSIQSAISGFGGWLLSAAGGFFSGLGVGIQGGIGALGNWMLSAAAGFFTGVASQLQSAVGSIAIHGSWHIPAVPVVLPNGADITFGAGGIVNGPTIAMLGEAGEREAVFPEHLWNLIPASAFSAIGGAGGVNIPSGSGRSGAATSTSQQGSAIYQTQVTVDSEDITRKVLAAHVENERFHHLNSWGQ
jgi:TP901 family phage tail tape measure protein